MDVDLERLYSPSQWSKRFSKPEDVEGDHVTFAANGEYICSDFTFRLEFDVSFAGIYSYTSS